MALLQLSDFVTWIGQKFTQVDWDSNLQTTVNALNSVTTGKDIAVPTVTTNQILGSAIDNDPALAADSAIILPTQQAVKAYVDNSVGDSIGTVFVSSTTISAVIPYTKVSSDKFLRFTISGAALGNVTGSVLISIPDIPYSITYTTQGPPVSAIGTGFGTSSFLAAGASSTGSAGPILISTNTYAAGSSGAYINPLGAFGASPISMGSEWIDVSTLSNALHNITITFTNLSSPTLAIYRNRA